MRTRFSDQITSCLLTGVALLVLVPVLGASSNGSQGNPEVLPPNSSFRGHTYAEWSERWWLWALSLPVDQNPITTNGTAPCENGQTGNVWFLAGIGGPGLVGPPTTIRCANCAVLPNHQRRMLRSGATPVLRQQHSGAAGMRSELGRSRH